ncbi:DUF4012 domain-containing protein [Dactylosporangium sp. AC04546]|uniref:DUF4012 domain-containing protein n=1 Tax=Dactylosporangium sp. AC04546 TaxID=2862460 RepID=UPI001EDD549E|nr:DUF4012 domain-containing protein [Dactylosporangium sp. AC04546]WVK84349.1 DUF4012 domain-containing protein [Dactylosporangium sp. AC04546]
MSTKRKVLAGVVVFVLVVAGAGLRLATVASSAAGHLQRAATLVGELETQVRAGDLRAARETAAELRRQTGEARADTRGPSWWLGRSLPAAGDDLGAVSVVAGAVDALAGQVLPPLLDAAEGLSGFVREPGPALERVRAAAPRIEAAVAVARDARARLGALDHEGLDPRIRAAVERVIAGLDRVAPMLPAAARAAELLPGLLGIDGPRTYLVLFQNLAEVRATGGMPGAFVVLRADHGAISIVEQGTAATTLGTFPAPVLPLDPDQQELYTDRLGRFPADVNLTPDFPTAAALAREMYRVRSGRTVDGVFATDPVALSYLLRATGPVPVPSGPALTAENAVRQLLSQVYLTIGAEADQDAYFAGAARAVFDRLVTRTAASGELYRALSRAAGERRLLAWSAHPEEQQAIAGTVFAGTLPEDDGERPTVGVFLDDGTGAKLGYYLTRSVELSVGPCLEDGSRQLGVVVTLGSNAPRTGLPRSVLGLGLAGEYTVRTNVMVYAPTGGTPVAAVQDGVPVDFGTGVDKGRTVAVFTVDLAPGARSTVKLALISGPLRRGRVTPRLVTTPGISPWAAQVRPGEACSK